MLVATITEQLASGLGLVAGAIAVGGFLSHAGPALSGASEPELRRATARGGVAGFKLGGLVVVLSAILDRLLT